MSVGFALTHEDVMDQWEASDRDKKRIGQIYNSWTGWSSMVEAAPIWHAASEETGNVNSPEPFMGDEETILDEEARESDVDLVERFRDHHRGVYEGQGIESVRLHRYVSDRVQEAEGHIPRTVESWTEVAAHVPEFAAEIHAGEWGSVVTGEIDIDQTYASYRTVDTFGTGQSEYVVALPAYKRYGHFQVRDLEEFVEGEGV